MSYLNVRGVDHYYQWIKRESKTPKEVMVFMHGWGGSARYWEPIAQQLAEQFDCLLYDLRGFGRSQPSPEASHDQIKATYDLETYTLDLAAFLEALGLERVSLHAHSTGSSIAALFLNRYLGRNFYISLPILGVGWSNFDPNGCVPCLDWPIYSWLDF